MQKIHDDSESARNNNRRVASGAGSDRAVLAAVLLGGITILSY